MSNLTEEEVRAVLAAGITDPNKLIDFIMTKFRALEAENAIYRDQIDNMQVAADNRVDQMTRIFAGYIMDKCGRKTVVVDPEELQHRFAHERVVQSAAKGGKIRYQLLPVEGGSDAK